MKFLRVCHFKNWHTPSPRSASKVLSLTSPPPALNHSHTSLMITQDLKQRWIEVLNSKDYNEMLFNFKTEDKTDGSLCRQGVLTSMESTTVLTWRSYGSDSNEPKLGGIYSDTVRIHTDYDQYSFKVSFRLGEKGRDLGILFCTVKTYEDNNFVGEMNYCAGEFRTNEGAKLFSQFALNHFIETETWAVCPSFEPVDYIDGTPYFLNGDEVVSSL